MTASDPEWLTRAQVARLAGVSHQAVSQAVTAERLASRDWQGVILIHLTDAEAYKQSVPRRRKS